MLFFALILIFISFLFGSLAGLLVYRVPQNMNFAAPNSFCPHCHKELLFWQKIPLLSFLILQGKCYFCGGKISKKYFFIEATTGLLCAPFIIKFINHANNVPELFFSYESYVELFFIFTFIAILVSLALIDVESLNLPHSLTYFGILLALGFHFFIDMPVLIKLAPNQSPMAKLGNLITEFGFLIFCLDFFVNNFNYLFFGKKANLEISSALSFRINFFNRHPLAAYSLWLFAAFYLFIANQDLFSALFFLLGILYLLNEIFIDFYVDQIFDQNNLEKNNSKEENTETESQNSQSILGGGDIAMLGFICCILGLKATMLVLFLASVIGLGIYLINKNQAFGAPLAISTLIVMILI